MKIAQHPKMLDIVKGYKIPFHSKLSQSKVPSQTIVSRERKELVKLEVKEILKKRAIRKVQFKAICSLPLVRKLVRVPFLPLLWFETSITNIHKKLLKVPMTALHRINIKMIIYLHDMLICHSLEEIFMSRDTVIFLQNLGFIMNWKKSVLPPVQEIEFLGLTMNSVTLKLSLSKTKVQKVVSECQNLLNNPQTSILELRRLTGLLKSTFQAVLPARLN